MGYRVMFSVKRMAKDDPDYGLLIDKVRDFPSMRAALQFSKTINSHITDTEVLVGKPLIEDAA